MNSISKFLLLPFIFLSLQINSQELDPSILSQLSPDQIEMFRKAYSGGNSTDINADELTIIDETLSENNLLEDSNLVPGKKFGYDFFSSMPTSIAAVGDLPLPNDYKISLRDQLRVILSGSKDSIFDLNIKLDGTILFPELGSIYVAGLTFGELKEKLTQMISESYIGVNIDVSIKSLSAKKITIVGAVISPGTYLINPFSTITSALAYSGGISEIGSLRNIKLIRNNGDVFYFDLYDLLIKGDRKKDLNIEAGDTILIQAASQFVEITGAVKRPAIYEILEDDKISDIVNYALGFDQTANKDNISVSFLDLDTASIIKKTVSNLDKDLDNALSVNVFDYQSNLQSNIQVIGAVEKPGFYDLVNYNSLEQLIDDLNFIDVYPWAAVIEQFDENNLVKSSTLFSLKDKSTFESIELLPNSRVYFANYSSLSFNDGTVGVNPLSSILIDEYTLRLEHKSRTYELPMFGKFSVSSIVDFLGLDMTDVDQKAIYVSPLDNIVIDQDYKNMNLTAKKFNTVSFRSSINDLITVSISGAVDYPGTYILDSRSTMQDLYRLIGDFKSEAFLDGVIFLRESVRERQLKSIEKSKQDLNEALLISMQKGDQIGDINLIRALSEQYEPEFLGRIAGNFRPESKNSLETILLDGDSIIIPKNPYTVNVLGEVLSPIAISFYKGISIGDAIENAGGYKDYANKKEVYVIKANGMIAKSKRNIFVKNINLEPGDTIIVPRKIITNTPGLQALVPITQVLSDMAFSAAAIESLSNN